METAGLPLPGYHYITPNHIVKAPIHWMGLRSQTSSVAYKLYNTDRTFVMQPQYGNLAPICFFKWTWLISLNQTIVHHILRNVCLHLLRVYKYFRYSIFILHYIWLIGADHVSDLYISMISGKAVLKMQKKCDWHLIMLSRDQWTHRQLTKQLFLINKHLNIYITFLVHWWRLMNL